MSDLKNLTIVSSKLEIEQTKMQSDINYRNTINTGIQIPFVVEDDWMLACEIANANNKTNCQVQFFIL